jgi:hypothetical protein
MALIIEDGTIVTGANSFVTDAELQTYATARGFALPATEAERDSLLILAVDYLFSKEQSMKGERINATQDLMYPRKGVCEYNFKVAKDAIPSNLKKAQMELAVQSNKSALLVTGTTQNLASFSVDGVYSESYHGGGSWEQVRTDRADAYLDPLLVNNGSDNIMVRV